MEIDLDEADARQRARLDVLHVTCLKKELLEAQGNRAFDFIRPHTFIKGGHRHHRDFDLRKDVHGHLLIGDNAEKDDDQAARDDCVGILK